MAAAGAALLVWTFTSGVADPPTLEPRFIVLVVLPFAVVLVFATAIKLVLAGGLRVPAIRLLVFAAVALVTATADVVVPTTDRFELINGRAAKLLWTSHGTLLAPPHCICHSLMRRAPWRGAARRRGASCRSS